MTSWKKLGIISASVGAGIVVLLAVIGLGIYWYYFHPRPARKWPDIRLSQIGITVTLSTKWSDGHLDYQFRASPITLTAVAEFDKAIHAMSQPPGFSVFLGDSDGFKLCTIPIDHLQDDLDAAGRTQSLSDDDKDFGCSLSEYSRASKWSVSWKYFPPVVIADAVPKSKGAAVGQTRSGNPPARYHEVQLDWKDNSRWRPPKKRYVEE
jgi:hypothetical protein